MCTIFLVDHPTGGTLAYCCLLLVLLAAATTAAGSGAAQRPPRVPTEFVTDVYDETGDYHKVRLSSDTNRLYTSMKAQMARPIPLYHIR
jgi:hypothetical protein